MNQKDDIVPKKAQKAGGTSTPAWWEIICAAKQENVQQENAQNQTRLSRLSTAEDYGRALKEIEMRLRAMPAADKNETKTMAKVEVTQTHKMPSHEKSNSLFGRVRGAMTTMLNKTDEAKQASSNECITCRAYTDNAVLHICKKGEVMEDDEMEPLLGRTEHLYVDTGVDGIALGAETDHE